MYFKGKNIKYTVRGASVRFKQNYNHYHLSPPALNWNEFVHCLPLHHPIFLLAFPPTIHNFLHKSLLLIFAFTESTGTRIAVSQVKDSFGCWWSIHSSNTQVPLGNAAVVITAELCRSLNPFFTVCMQCILEEEIFGAHLPLSNRKICNFSVHSVFSFSKS